MQTSKWRGHPINMNESGQWVYSDTLMPVELNKTRKCGICKKSNKENDHDPCLGELPGLMNACCGHGDLSECYIQFLDSTVVSGNDAKVIIDILKKYKNEL